MMRNKKGEEMVEAAMVLPILILVTFSLMLVMVYFYQIHQSQIALHKEMLRQRQVSSAVFRVNKETQKNETRVDGMVNHLLKAEKQHRIYHVKPSRWILLGEMAGIDDG